MWLSPTTWWQMAHVGGRREEVGREGKGWLAQAPNTETDSASRQAVWSAA